MIQSLLEISAVVFFRFPWLLRIWAMLVVVVNAASIGFLYTMEGMVVFLSTIIALIVMTMIHKRIGFVRLLGIGHFTWFAMLPWLLFRLPLAESNIFLYVWMVVLITVNAICLVVDLTDVVRFAMGDRLPHYKLKPGTRS